MPFFTVQDRVGPWDWFRGGLAGFIGSVGMGIIMMFFMGGIDGGGPLGVGIPNMYGIEGPHLGFGWFFHQFHGVMLGLGYVAWVEYEPMSSLAEPRTIGGGMIHGIIWGVLTTIVLAVIVMPIWLGLVDLQATPPLPNINPVGLLAHLVYALPIGILYALYRN